MKARVKPGVRWHSITSCAGLTFVKEEWRDVPEEREEEAMSHESLEVDIDFEEMDVEDFEALALPSDQSEEPEEVDEDDDVEEEVADLVEIELDVSGAAKTLADASDIDLRTVVGTGLAGKITVTDVRNALEEGRHDN